MLTPLRVRAACLAALATVSILSGCQKSPGPGTPAQIEVASPSTRDAVVVDRSIEQQKRYQWNRQVLIDAYLRMGTRDDRWDEAATNAMEQSARADIADPIQLEQLVERCAASARRAVELGCDDSLVLQLDLFMGGFREGPGQPASMAAATMANAARMAGTDHHPLLKFYACSSAAKELDAVTEQKGSPEVQKYRWQALRELARTLEDTEVPPEEVFNACKELDELVKYNEHQLTNFYRMLEPLLVQNWSATGLADLVKGRLFITCAWQGRGWDGAAAVKPEQWRLFKERLQTAEQALRKAWNANPSNPQIANEMLTVCMGVSKPRAEMEVWFERAMVLNPANAQACDRKLYYLNPKWHGSVEEMIAFGRECARSTNWGGFVPLYLIDAYRAAEQYVEQDERAEYWKSPAIWNDISSVYRRFLAAHPECASRRHWFAWWAYRCGQHVEFTNQLAQLSTTNDAYFGGHDKFREMLRVAAQQNARR